MAFRVLVLGGRAPIPFPRLRDALDVLLAHRLPDVQFVTAGGPGVPALAASYARSRGLELVTVTPVLGVVTRRGTQPVEPAPPTGLPD